MECESASVPPHFPTLSTASFVQPAVPAVTVLEIMHNVQHTHKSCTGFMSYLIAAQVGIRVCRTDKCTCIGCGIAYSHYILHGASYFTTTSSSSSTSTVCVADVFACCNNCCHCRCGCSRWGANFCAASRVEFCSLQTHQNTNGKVKQKRYYSMAHTR